MQRIQKTIAEFVVNASRVTVAPADPVSVAVAAMREHKVDCVLVVDSDALVGIFTERDFLHRVTAEHRDPATTAIEVVMTRNPDTLRETDCMTYAINKMAVRGFRNVPIVDEAGRPLSVLDVRIVMMHLLKVFAEVEKENAGRPPGADTDSEWVDIGGG